MTPGVGNGFQQQLIEAETEVEADQRRALQLASELLQRQDLTDNARLRALIVSCRASVWVQGPRTALEQCQQAVELAEADPDKSYLLRARNVRGTAFYELGQIKDAFADFSAALALARRLGDLKLTSRLANNLGVVTRNSGALEQAIEYFSESIEVAKATDYDYMEAVASINLGDSYTQLERFDGALAHLQQGLEAAQRTADSTLSLSANVSIAEILSKQGDPSRAATHLRPLIAQTQERNIVVARAHEVLADAYSDLGVRNQAVNALDEALGITRELDAVLRHNYLLVNLAKLQRSDANPGIALETITAPIRFARQQNHDQLLRTGLREQTLILADLQRPDDALASDQEADELEHAFNTRRANEQLSMLRVTTEQAKTERELALALQRQTATELRAEQDRWVRNGALVALAFVLGLVYLWRNRRRSMELRHLVAKRTQALMEQTEARQTLEAQLFQSQKLEAIGQLTGGIAHDFNNLLTVIIGALDLLRNGERLKFEDQALIEDALAAAESGTDITQQLLAFARKQNLRPEEFDLVAHVKDLQRLLSRSLGGERRLVVTLPSSPIPVELDRGQLTSALLNLVINARDAVGQNGEVVIAITTLEIGSNNPQLLEPGHYACINVRDNGHGMTSNELGQACDPFFSTKPLAAGSGLGLSMVYGFAKQSAGELVLSSELGQGTEIQLFLPLLTTAILTATPAGATLAADPAPG